MTHDRATTQNFAFSPKKPVDQRFLGRYSGTMENTTEGRPGRGRRSIDMSIDIERSDKKGYVQLNMSTKGGLNVKGTLIGEIAADGQLRATGTIAETAIYVFRKRRAWDRNLIGLIRGNRLKGTYSLFPRTVGRVTPEGIPGMPDIRAVKAEGSFDLEKFTPLVQSQ